MEGIIDLHHDLMFFLILIVILVSFLLFDFVIGFDKKSSTNQITDLVQSKLLIPTKIQHNTLLEII